MNSIKLNTSVSFPNILSHAKCKRNVRIPKFCPASKA